MNQQPMSQPGMQGSGSWSDTPPPGIKGVSDAPMIGAPLTDSDAKMWGMLAQLSVLIGTFFAIFGWVGPLIIYLVYHDRNRFVRYQAAEALNGAISVFVLNIAIFIAGTILTIVSFGLLSFALFLVYIPGIVQMVFAIVAAVKANNGIWWNYPVNLRLMK